MKIGKEYYQQGTTKYAEAITKNMAKASPNTTDKKAANAIEVAIESDNNIKYLHIKTPITKTDDGSIVGEVEISEFDIELL